MSVFAICSEPIDWSAMGSMLGGIASLGTFFIALYALKTWKRGIELQDRYEKVERLLMRTFCVWRRAINGKWLAGLARIEIFPRRMNRSQRGFLPIDNIKSLGILYAHF